MGDLLNIVRIMCKTLRCFVFAKPRAIISSYNTLLFNATCKKIENSLLVLMGNEMAKNYKDYAPKGVKKPIEDAKLDENGFYRRYVFYMASF